MLKSKNIETDGLLRDVWNHIAFLTRQTWNLRGEARKLDKKYPAYSTSGSGAGWDKAKIRTYRMEIGWLRDMAVEHDVAA